LNSPCAHSRVSRFQTKRLASYEAEIPIFWLSTWILETVELWPWIFWHLIILLSHRHSKLSMPALRTRPSYKNLPHVTQSEWPYFLAYKFLKHFPVFLYFKFIRYTPMCYLQTVNPQSVIWTACHHLIT